MIHYIKGTIESKHEDRIVIDNAGIGYEIFVPSGSAFYLAEKGESVKVYTHMAVKEDDVSLFGFSSESGRELFEKLITVNSVGAKAAMSILSAVPEESLKKAIILEDTDTITRAKGVGKKMAQKIVLELKDKITEDDIAAVGRYDTCIASISDDRSEALDALVSLGYSKIEASSALAAVSDDGLSTEEYIKRALKNI